mmetsp:Transcript_15363/g.46373  ORF Transcript_15363/g.46373 Transcript_15363/m.46373 type:complete len:342 (+) Transcript_15363:122-1147(+)
MHQNTFLNRQLPFLQQRSMRQHMAALKPNMFQAYMCKSATRANAGASPHEEPPPSPVTRPGFPSGSRAGQHAAVEGPATPAKALTPKKRKAASVDTNVAVEGAAEGLCGGLPENLGSSPLRLILVGHNPSAHAWKSGHYYSNPSNWMWKLLCGTGIAPPSIRGAQDDMLMPSVAQVGMVDVGCGVPGTDSSQFSSATFQGWAAGFYSRLTAHMHRATDSIGCTCGACGAPAIVAFTGKRQFMELLNAGKTGRAKHKTVPLGPTDLRPEGWPLPGSTEVWVLTTTSGAAPMTVAERTAPYQRLADRLACIPLRVASEPLSCRSPQSRSHDGRVAHDSLPGPD